MSTTSRAGPTRALAGRPAGRARRVRLAEADGDAGRDSGMVTVEAALALCAFVAMLAMALAAVSAALDEMRCMDAAREAARLVARGDRDLAARAVADIAPRGATFAVAATDGTISVSVGVTPAGGLLPGVHVDARAYAVPEPEPATEPAPSPVPGPAGQPPTTDPAPGPTPAQPRPPPGGGTAAPTQAGPTRAAPAQAGPSHARSPQASSIRALPVRARPTAAQPELTTVGPRPVSAWLAVGAAWPDAPRSRTQTRPTADPGNAAGSDHPGADRSGRGSRADMGDRSGDGDRTEGVRGARFPAAGAVSPSGVRRGRGAGRPLVVGPAPGRLARSRPAEGDGR